MRGCDGGAANPMREKAAMPAVVRHGGGGGEY
jgi:hypothetical protein